jgi:hypothetical protein
MSHASPLPLRLPLRNLLKTRKACSEVSHHIPLHMRDQVRVGVQRDRYAEVAEDFLEDLRVFARLQPQSCEGVSCEGVSEVAAARSAAQKLTVVSPRNICAPFAASCLRLYCGAGWGASTEGSSGGGDPCGPTVTCAAVGTPPDQTSGNFVLPQASVNPLPDGLRRRPSSKVPSLRLSGRV